MERGLGGEALTSFPEARALVLANVEPLGTESVRTKAMDRRVFAQDLVCPYDVPHFDNSQVDGYAVRAGDVGPRWVIGESAAGGEEPPALLPGTAVRIFTGAPIPLGADAVVMQEDAQKEEDRVAFSVTPAPGGFIRRKGEEIAAGAVFPTQGRVATPPLIGLAASFGLTHVEASAVPRTTVLATGSELIWPGFTLKEGQVYASNPYALVAALRPLGIEATFSKVPDRWMRMREAMEKAHRQFDVIVTVGGVSVGDRDLVRSVLADCGFETVLWRVAMKPGKPFFMGRSGEKVVFGLPGNPVSALVTFALLVRPALRKMIGLADVEEETAARLGATIRRDDLRYEFLRATLSGGIATPVSAQGSHMQTGLAFADALIHVPDGVAALEAGDEVRITPLGWGL